LVKQHSEEKLALAPVITAAVLDVAAKSPLDEFSRRRLTAFVGRALRESGCGRMLTADLQAALRSKGFNDEEIDAGLRRLDASNKILLMDGLAFLV
jgi:hypothetical protein